MRAEGSGMGEVGETMALEFVVNVRGRLAGRRRRLCYATALNHPLGLSGRWFGRIEITFGLS